MSGGLAPSKSTVYVSSLPFSLTNNDLHKIFAACGQVVKVTIMRDKTTRKSRGVAFVQFLERESAYKAVRSFNNTQMFGRTLKCSIAKDNGRAAEFIRRKNYTDKSRCYECGEEGHLSYACPKNALGEREPPPKKEKKRKKRKMEDAQEEIEDPDSDAQSAAEEEAEDPKLESLSAAISFQQQLMEAEARDADVDADSGSTRKKFRKDAYFSDEEELCD